jgi:hypothetical protein
MDEPESAVADAGRSQTNEIRRAPWTQFARVDLSGSHPRKFIGLGNVVVNHSLSLFVRAP